MTENKLTGGMKLTLIQNQMKAPKTQFNSFSKFYYRTTDEIQYFLKPLCEKYHTQVVPTSECVWVGPDARGALFQKATVSMLDADTGELIAESTAMAREDDDKKGMSAPQSSASAAQFAVKRALEQLLMLDGSAPEVDAMRPTGMTQQAPQRQVPQPQQPRRHTNIPYEPFAYDSEPATPRQARPTQPDQAPRQAKPAQAPRSVQTPQNASQKPVQPQQAQVQQSTVKAAQTAQKQPQQADPDAQFITAPAVKADPWAANMKDTK